MPIGARRGLVAGAVLLVVVAAGVNIAHTRQNALDQGADDWTAAVIGLLPDVMLVLSVTRLRYHRRSLWAWAGVGVSVALIAWSALATAAEHGIGGRVVALVCLSFAIIATGQAHVPPAEATEIVMAHVEALADDAVRTARLAVEQAHADAAVRAHEAAEATARAASLEGALAAEQEAHATARAAHAAALAERTETAPDAAVRRPARRTAGARKPTARAGAQGGDLQRRAAVRSRFEASVRSDSPLDNAALARLLYDLPEGVQPEPGQLRAASARASEWRRAIAPSERTEATS